MYVEVSQFRHWKSEHDQRTCEDAAGASVDKGLFVVADGVGMRAFSSIWARILVEQFVNEAPLLSNDPFEIEWWVRMAQEQYKLQKPRLINRGLPESQSTLAALRFLSSDGTSARAQLLAFGDSCIIIHRHGDEHVRSFALQNPSDFDSPPLCVPADLKDFYRNFHLCKLDEVTLQEDDIVILATDAVAKWIVSAGKSHYQGPLEAFREVAQRDEKTWATFIEDCRRNKGMDDDDSTVLILKLKGKGKEEEHLGITREYSGAIIKKRQEDFEQARKDDNKELVAVAYGDARSNFAKIDIAKHKIVRARRVADAFREVLHALRNAFANSNPTTRAKLESIWRSNAYLLLDEPLAEGLRRSLVQVDVPTELPEARARREAIDAIEKAVDCDDDLEIIRVFDQKRGQQLKNDMEVLGYAVRVQDAIERKQVLNEILKFGTAQQKVHAYDELHLDSNDLSQDEHKQVNLARELIKAYQHDSDEEIIKVHREIRASPFGHVFSFDEQEKQRINLAEQRSEALQYLAMTLAGGTSSLIVRMYETVQSSYPKLLDKLAEDEQYLVRLARQFIEAYRANDDKALASIYTTIYFSPYMSGFGFTNDESIAISRIQDWISPNVSIVNGEPITLEQLQKLKDFKMLYLPYRIERLGQNLSSEQQKEEIERLQAQKDDLTHLLRITLNELVDDVFLRNEQMLQSPKRLARSYAIFSFFKPSPFDLEAQCRKNFKEFKNFKGRQYDLSLSKADLQDQDVMEELHIIVKRDLFESYLREQQPPIRLLDWLNQRRREARIIYPEWAARDDESINTDPTRCWLFKWRGIYTPLTDAV